MIELSELFVGMDLEAQTPWKTWCPAMVTSIHPHEQPPLVAVHHFYSDGRVNAGVMHLEELKKKE